MTTPNQPLPATVETALGMGAFTVDSDGNPDGGYTNYGQNITQDFVHALVNGPATILVQAFSSIEHFIEQLGQYLLSLPLQALQNIARFLPGGASLDFSSPAAAVNSILDALGLRALRMTVQAFEHWIATVFNVVIQDVRGVVQALLDIIHNALTGAFAVMNTMEDLAVALTTIPGLNILGVGGPANIVETILTFLNRLVGGLVGAPSGEGATLSDVYSMTYQISDKASQGANAWQVVGIRNNTDVASGFLPTGRSNFPLTSAMFLPDANVLACKQIDTGISTYRVQDSSPLGVVSWLGYGTTNLTAFYINVWKIDPVSGDWALAHHSTNQISGIVAGTTPQFQFYELPDPLAVVAGDQLGIELVPTGSGTHFVVGMSSGAWVPSHPTAVIAGYGAGRNDAAPNSPPSSIDRMDINWESGVAWIELAIDLGDGTGADSFSDLTEFLNATVETIPIPKWANFIDLVIVGAGGPGAAGTTLGFFGEPGKHGQWKGITLRRGVHYGADVTTLSFSCGVGSASGPGGSSSATVGIYTIEADGGAAGVGTGFLALLPGEAAGLFTYNGFDCQGGTTQGVAGSAGAAPGGGGCGGRGLLFQHGGKGADGGGFVRFRQNGIDGEIDSTDTTPPTDPTMTVSGVSDSTITVHMAGSTDE